MVSSLNTEIDNNNIESHRKKKNLNKTPCFNRHEAN